MRVITFGFISMASLLIIAIDGPAASGKGTLSRKLAAKLSLPHLDTGLTYRAVAHALLQDGAPLDDEDKARLLNDYPALEFDPHTYGQFARRHLSSSEAAILNHAA